MSHVALKKLMLPKEGQRKKRCTKHFPKEFQEVTVMNEDGYPKYRRRILADSIRSGAK